MNQNQPEHSSDRLDPLPPLSPNALDALLISTKKLLDECRSRMRAQGYGHLIPSNLHSVK